MISFRKVQAAALAGVFLLAATACGDDDKDSADTTVAETMAPTTVAETTPPTDAPTTVAAPDFDADAAAAEVEANVVGLFDQLAIAGNEATSADDKAAAIAAAAALVEGGDCPAILETVPTIAGLAAAANLTLVIDEAPTFNAEGTEANYLFSALSNGAPSQLDHSNGISVLEDGTWKLASEIWGAFISMGGGTPPDASAFSC